MIRSASPGQVRLLDVLDCGVALFDSEARILLWNHWMERSSGMKAADVHGRTLEEVFGDQVSTVLSRTVRDACTDGLSALLSNQLHRYPIPLTRGSGTRAVAMEQSVLVRPLPRCSDVQGAVCVMQVSDVSSAVRRERHLRESRTELRLRNRAIEASSQGIIIVDARKEGRPIIYANPAFTVITGYTAEEVLGRNCKFLQGPDVDQPGLDAIRAALSEQREGMAVLRNYRKDGTLFWNELLVSPVFDTDGVLTNFVGIQRDISKRRKIEEQRDQAMADLRQANEKLSHEQRFTATVLRTIGALVAVVDRRGRIVSFNRACETATGLPEKQALGTRLADLIPDQGAWGYFRLDQGATTPPQGLRTGLVSHSGDRRSIRWSFSHLTNGDEMATHLICTGIDVTERDRAYALLQSERTILEMVARAEPLDSLMGRLCEMIESQLPEQRASLTLLDARSERFVRAIGPSLSPDFLSVFEGREVAPSLASCGPVAHFGHPHYSYDVLRDPNWSEFREVCEASGVRSCWSVPILSSDQAVLGSFDCYGAMPHLPDNSSIEVLLRAARIASIAIERHRAAERIQYLALYDQLTGLANRALLSDRLQSATSHAMRHDGKLALLFIDLDGFKPINDAYGHDAGDVVLAAVGSRVRAALRTTDTAARIGGDEFVLLIEDVQNAASVTVVADKVLRTLCQPVQWQGETLHVGASIGIALFPQDATDADALLTAADDAMYRAKQAGKNRWVWGQEQRLIGDLGAGSPSMP
ncbi:diguanylate cyclase domain-containing protein [Insolitispirillum peregrinum]|uniref:diguanylate cyclase domain-containing protein n=1 Tax=Insolitispirillum peregrinum TaxID=80876 RepID=UPI00361C8840